jgi:spermidine synthase
MFARKIPLAVLCVALWSALQASGTEKVLCERVSQYNTIFVTEDDQGLRILRFERDGARQSVVKPGDPDHLELPYSRAILAGLVFCERPRRVLIVGLGGGTIPTFLRKHFPELTIDVVEIDQGVFDVAKEYFGFREDERMHVFIDDGRRFITNCRTPYDIVFLDAFDSDSVPYHLTTREFLQIARRAVAPTGAVVGNIWSRRTNRLHDAMVRTYQEAFDAVYLYHVPQVGNEILIALPRHEQLLADRLRQRGAEISRRQQFPFDLGSVAANGVEHLADKDPRAGVLEDGKEPVESSGN